MNASDQPKPSDSPPTPLWDTLLLHVNIATMKDAQGYGMIENAALGISAGRIAWLGPVETLPDAPERLAGNVIECDRKWVTPGLIDCYNQCLDSQALSDDAAQKRAGQWLVSLMKEGATAVARLPDVADEAKVVELSRKLEATYPLYIYTLLPHLQRVVPASCSIEDAQALERAGVVAVLLPSAYYFSERMERPSVAVLREQRVKMALATGCNPMTLPYISLLLLLNMGCRFLGLTPEEALKGVTCNAAQALGLSADIGTLAVGKLADMAFWDIRHPDELSWHLGYNPCLGLFKNGVLYRVSS